MYRLVETETQHGEKFYVFQEEEERGGPFSKWMCCADIFWIGTCPRVRYDGQGRLKTSGAKTPPAQGGRRT